MTPIEYAADAMVREARTMERIALMVAVGRDRAYAWGDGYDRASSRAMRAHARSLRLHAREVLDAANDDELLGRALLAQMRNTRLVDTAA